MILSQDLILRAQAGDRQVLDAVYDLHLGLCKKIASKYTKYAEFSDLLQEVSLGFLHALRLYDPCNAKHATLATYAVWWMEAAARRYCQMNRLIMFPFHLLDLRISIRKRLRLGYPLSDILMELHVTDDQIATLVAIDNQVVSLDVPITDTETLYLSDTIYADDLDSHDLRDRQLQLLDDAIAVLDEPFRSVVILRRAGDSYKAISSRLGMTPARASRMYDAAIAQIASIIECWQAVDRGIDRGLQRIAEQVS